MKNTSLLVALLLLLSWSAPSPATQAPPAQPPAQKPTQPPGQPAGQPATSKPAAPRPAQSRGSVTFFITNPQGRGVNAATVSMTGPTTREGETNRDGVVALTGVRAGNYRVRVEAEDYITLERDIAARSGLEVEMTLNPSPEEPSRPAPDKTPPAPASPTPTPSVIPPDPNATIQLSSVVEFFSKNQLPRNQPRSEDVVGQAPQATSSLLQVRSTFEGRTHQASDEVLYVINGKAEVNSKGRIYQVETGSLVVIPRGVTYSISNKGRDPLWALSVLAGSK